MPQVQAIQIKLALQTTGEVSVKRFIDQIQKIAAIPAKINLAGSFDSSAKQLTQTIKKQIPNIANVVADGIEQAFGRIWAKFTDIFGKLESDTKKNQSKLANILLGDNFQTTVARQMGAVATQLKAVKWFETMASTGHSFGTVVLKDIQQQGTNIVAHYINRVAPMLEDAYGKMYRLFSVVSEVSGSLARGDSYLKAFGKTLTMIGAGLTGLLTTTGYFFFSGVFFKGAVQFIEKFLGIQKQITILERVNRIVITIDKALHSVKTTTGAIFKTMSIGVLSIAPSIFGILNPFNTIITKLAFANSFVSLISHHLEKSRLKVSAFFGSGLAQIRLAFLNIRNFMLALTGDFTGITGLIRKGGLHIASFLGGHTSKIQLAILNFRSFFMWLAGMLPKIMQSFGQVIDRLPAITKAWAASQDAVEKARYQKAKTEAKAQADARAQAQAEAKAAAKQPLPKVDYSGEYRRSIIRNAQATLATQAIPPLPKVDYSGEYRRSIIRNAQATLATQAIPPLPKVDFFARIAEKAKAASQKIKSIFADSVPITATTAWKQAASNLKKIYIDVQDLDLAREAKKIGFLPVGGRRFAKPGFASISRLDDRDAYSSSWDKKIGPMVMDLYRNAQRQVYDVKMSTHQHTAFRHLALPAPVSRLALPAPAITTQKAISAPTVAQTRPTIPLSGPLATQLLLPSPEDIAKRKQAIVDLMATLVQLGMKLKNLAAILKTSTGKRADVGSLSAMIRRQISLSPSLDSPANLQKLQAAVKKSQLAKSVSSMPDTRYLRYSTKIPDEIAKGIQSNPEQLKKAMDAIASMLLDYLPHSPAKVGPLRTLRQSGSSILSELAIGMNAGTGKIRNAIIKVTSAMARFFPHSPAEEGPLRGLRDWGMGIISMLSLGVSDRIQSFLAIFVNLANQIKATLKPVLELEMMGQRIGVSGQELRLLQHAFAGFEVSASDVQMALSGINRTLSEVAAPEKIAALARVGINLQAVRAAANPAQEMLMQLADAAHRFPASSAEMVKAFDALGVSAQSNLINALSMGRKEIQAGMIEGVKMGAVYEESFAKAGHSFTEMMNKLEKIGGYLETEFVSVVLPIIDEITRKFFDFYKDNADQIRSFVRVAAQAFSILIETISKTVTYAIQNPTKAYDAIVGLFVWMYNTGKSFVLALFEDAFDGLVQHTLLFFKHTLGAAIEAGWNLVYELGKATFLKLKGYFTDTLDYTIGGKWAGDLYKKFFANESKMPGGQNAQKPEESVYEQALYRIAAQNEKLLRDADEAIEQEILALGDSENIKKTTDRIATTWKEASQNFKTTMQDTGFDKIFSESMSKLSDTLSAENFQSAENAVAALNAEAEKLPSILDRVQSKTEAEMKQFGIEVTLESIQEAARNAANEINRISEAMILAGRESTSLKDQIASMQLDLQVRISRNEDERKKAQQQKDALELKAKQEKELIEYEGLLIAKYQKDAQYIRTTEEYRDFVKKQGMEREKKVESGRQGFFTEEQEKILNLWTSGFGNMETAFGKLYEMMGKKVVAFFYLQKAAAMAQAIVNTALAVSKAWAEGGVSGPILAGIAAAAGATQIGVIAAQTMQGPTGYASGGEVEGRGTKDTVPAMLTPGEFIIPRGAVEYYGLQALEGLRNKLINKDVLQNLSAAIPTPTANANLAFSGGGMVPMVTQITQTQTPVAAPPINIVNIQDPTQFDRYLASNHGQEVIMNVVSANMPKLQRSMR